MKKHEITGGTIKGAVDNLTVVNRINDGHDDERGNRKAMATDHDVWDETMALLQRIPATCTLRHVKGHQDNLYKRGREGPLPRDAYWNVQMDRKVNLARLSTPTRSATVFESSLAEFIHKDQPVHTKIGRVITKAFLDQPLRRYIQ